jgi:integrase
MRGHLARHGRGWRYVVDVGKDPATGRRRQVTKGGFLTRRDAQEALAESLKALHDGTYRKPSRRTLESFLSEWLGGVRHTIRENTWESYALIIRRYINPNIGQLFLQDITPTGITRFYANLSLSGARSGRGLSPKSVRNIHVVLRRALEDAPLLINPAAKAKPPKSRRNQINPWTAGELRRFLEAARDDRYYVAYWLGATTGMRRSEILGLRWADVDVERKSLAVQQVLTAYSTTSTLKLTPPKTPSSRRRIDLDIGTVEALRLHRSNQHPVSELVFTQPNGEPVSPWTVSASFKRTALSLGLPPLTFHGLRHTWATLALSAGVQPKIVQERLGHSSIQVTSDIYQHAIPGLQREAADTVAAMIKGP